MKVTVASYNVHGFVGTDGVRDVARVAKVLKEIDADVIALQEVVFAVGNDDPVELLAELAGYQAVTSPHSRRDGVRLGNAVLSRLPVKKTRTIKLDFMLYEPRSALEVWLETSATPLRVVATHLGLRPGERRFQVKQILEHVAGDEQSVTVLLGDFNEWFLAGRPLRWLHQRFGRGAAVKTFPSRFPLVSLDRIWVHPRAALRGFRARKNKLTKVASDHLPVVATLELGAPASS